MGKIESLNEYIEQCDERRYGEEEKLRFIESS